MKALQALSPETRVATYRCVMGLLDRALPELGGRVATDLFLGTRSNGRAALGIPAGAIAKRLGGSSGIGEVYVWGKSGRPVFLVHGWGSDSGAMCSLVRPLRERGYRVVAFDAPAHGSNDGNHTTMTKFVKGVQEVLEQFDPEHEARAIVGHSLGALATVAALAKVQQPPERLVLISAPSSLNQTLRSFVGYWRLSNHMEQRIRDQLLSRHGVPIEHWDIRTLSTLAPIPALVVHDSDDRLVPWQEAHVVATALGPTARTELTQGLGHARILADRRATSLVADFIAADVAEARGSAVRAVAG